MSSFIWLIVFESRKSSFSVIVQTSSFSCCFACVFLSNLDWFWSSKRQNNCSHVSRRTLTGLGCSALLDYPLIFFYLYFIDFLIGDIKWTLICICYTVIDLRYKHQNFDPYKCQHLHQIAYFCSVWVSVLNKTEPFFSSIFSLHQTIWTVKAWLIR